MLCVAIHISSVIKRIIILNNYDEFDDWTYVYGYMLHIATLWNNYMLMLYSWPALNSWPVKAEGVKYLFILFEDFIASIIVE